MGTVENFYVSYSSENVKDFYLYIFRLKISPSVPRGDEQIPPYLSDETELILPRKMGPFSMFRLLEVSNSIKQKAPGFSSPQLEIHNENNFFILKNNGKKKIGKISVIY